MTKTFAQHLQDLQDLKAKLEDIGQFKASYKPQFSAVEGTLRRLADVEQALKPAIKEYA